MVRVWLASGLVALSCAACGLPVDGLAEPSAAGASGGLAPDANVPLTHADAGPLGTIEASAPVTKDAGGPKTEAAAPDAGAPDSASPQLPDSGDDSGDEGGDQGDPGGHGGDRRLEAH